MAILGEDHRLIEAHKQAVAQTLQELEAHAGARVRLDGANEDRITGNVVVAVYNHDTSRELDPQLHTHAVAANLTYDGTEGRWKALQASGVYERRAYLTEVYRNALAREVIRLGYEIENRRDGKGRDCGFEIRGVSEELLSKYSRRSRQRDEAIERFMSRHGRPPTDNEVAVLIRETRADKLIEISTVELRKQQRERLTLAEARELHDLRCEFALSVQLEPAARSLNYALDHLFERVSVCRDHEVLTEALRHGRGKVSQTELLGALSLREYSREVIRKGNEIATAASLVREREMIEHVNRGIGACERLGRDTTFVVSDRLDAEQRHAVEFVLDSTDRAVNVRGAAGTGKTATLEELRRGLKQSKREVLAVAPTTSAVEELRRVGFKNAVTVERVLQDQAVQSKLKNKVMILDEAGMVSGRQMVELLKLTERQSARIVFSGDTGQIQSVEACDALRILEQESRLKSVALGQVRRQSDKNYREAIQELRCNPEEGLKRLNAMGAVREATWAERAQAIAHAFEGERSKRRSTLVVCATHDEIGRVTEAIRSMRRQTGDMGGSVSVARDVSLNWTAAQKSNPHSYRPGLVLGFHRRVDGFMKNETVEVTRVENGTVMVRNDRGEERSVTARHTKSLDAYDRQTIEVAAGDRLLITANRREAGFRATNGEVVTVARVSEKGSIQLADGRVLPANFKQFAYGYAVTAHRSQGKSVDSVIISGDGMQKELFYVAASRGRQSITIITSDKEMLCESIGRSAVRKSALELTRKEQPSIPEMTAVRTEPEPAPVRTEPDPAPSPARPRMEAVKGAVLRRSPRQEPQKEHSHDDGMSL
jgi:ATP-dependent exoDNAse (exonuclease V) alpha subunit